MHGRLLTCTICSYEQARVKTPIFDPENYNEVGDYRNARDGWILGDDECPEDVEDTYGADNRYITGDDWYRDDEYLAEVDSYNSEEGYDLEDYLCLEDVDQGTSANDGDDPHYTDDGFNLDDYDYPVNDDWVSHLCMKRWCPTQFP